MSEYPSDYPFNAPTEYPGAESATETDTAAVEVESVPGAITPDQEWLLKPFFRGTKILEHLTMQDKEFMHDAVGLIIDYVYTTRGDKALTNSDSTARQRRAGLSIGRVFMSEAAEAICDGTSIEAFSVKKKSMKPGYIKDKIGLFSDVATKILYQDSTLNDLFHKKCEEYARKDQNKLRKEALDATEPGRSLPEVMKMLLSQGFLNEAQYYALSHHIGTVVITGEEPTGTTALDVERRRKRTLAKSSVGLDAAIRTIQQRYQSKARVAALPRNDIQPLSPHLRKILYYVTGDRVNDLPRIPRNELTEKCKLLWDSNNITPPSDEEIDQFIADALSWVFNLPNANT